MFHKVTNCLKPDFVNYKVTDEYKSEKAAYNWLLTVTEQNPEHPDLSGT